MEILDFKQEYFVIITVLIGIIQGRFKIYVKGRRGVRSCPGADPGIIWWEGERGVVPKCGKIFQGDSSSSGPPRLVSRGEGQEVIHSLILYSKTSILSNIVTNYLFSNMNWLFIWFKSGYQSGKLQCAVASGILKAMLIGLKTTTLVKNDDLEISLYIRNFEFNG